jgi:hypothetical protein
MLLGRPWLKQTKAHHDWGNKTLTITVDTNTVTLNMEKQIMVHPSQRPCNLDDTYDWEGELTNGNEEHLYHAVLELWLVREVSPEELKLLPEKYVRMVQFEDDINYLLWYYHHKP